MPGPLGFGGKAGAVVGVGMACTGGATHRDSASIAIMTATDCKILGPPVSVDGTLLAPLLVVGSVAAC